jgi:hypothetical protein
MHRMWGFPGVAGHRALSAGTVLILGGGLVLYQMTSLVLGPSGCRQLDLSLTVPGADLEERSESWTSTKPVAIGTLAGPSRAASAPTPSVAHRGSATRAGHAAAPPVSVQPVASQAPTAHPSAPPAPPIAVRPDPQPGAPPSAGAD